MSEEVKIQLIKRLKSLAWRALGFVLAGLLAVATEFIAKVGLPPIAVAIIGLIIGEITKFLNSQEKLTPNLPN